MTRSGKRRGARGSRYPLLMKLTGTFAVVMTATLVCGTLYVYAKERSLWDGIHQIKLTDLGKRPPQYSDALNILLIGSDSRSGKNARIGGWTPGQRSDTVMVVHISPGRKQMSVLSFPRDSVVPILSCPKSGSFGGQSTQSGQVEQVNATFANGGPNCLLKTLEQETGIRLNDFIQLNFTGFISVINDLNGVEVCTPVAIHPSPYDHLNLSAGPHLIKGYKALEWWRLREDFGLGSDLQRIERDQLLMVSLVQKLLKSGVLHSASKTYKIISDIIKAHALTTDTGLTPTVMLHVATSMSGISRKSIQFIEVPTVEYQPNPNWVQWDPTQAPALFAAVEHNSTLPKIKHKKQGKAGKGSKSSTPALLSPSKISLEVLNGSGVNGIAGQTGASLTTRGFKVLGEESATTSAGADDYSYTKSVVEYSSTADLAAAKTVAAQLTDVTLEQNSSVKAGTVTLILGSTFKSLANANSQPIANLAGQYDGYTGSTNVCKGYGSAFLQ
jgi:LCP family protein required for cell wall assembly